MNMLTRADIVEVVKSHHPSRNYAQLKARKLKKESSKNEKSETNNIKIPPLIDSSMSSVELNDL